MIYDNIYYEAGKKLNYENYSNNYKNYNIENFNNYNRRYIRGFIVIFICIYLLHLLIKNSNIDYQNILFKTLRLDENEYKDINYKIIIIIIIIYILFIYNEPR